MYYFIPYLVHQLVLSFLFQAGFVVYIFGLFHELHYIWSNLFEYVDIFYKILDFWYSDIGIGSMILNYYYFVDSDIPKILGDTVIH
jgi:hypothetical protein